MPLSYVWPGPPIRIGGVVYEDGTEEGDEVTRATLRGQKEHQKNQEKEKEGAPPQ